MSKDANIAKHREIISHPEFQKSINLALLHYTRTLSVATQDSQAAAANMFKLKGAQEFAQEFLYLAEPVNKPQVVKPVAGQLDHNA